MDGLINDFDKKKALLLYSIKGYESRLSKYQWQDAFSSIEKLEIAELSDVLIQSYQQYLDLIAPELHKVRCHSPIDHLQAVFSQLPRARNQLENAKTTSSEMAAILHLIDLYQQLKRFVKEADDQQMHQLLYDDFEALAAIRQPRDWLAGLLSFCNKHKADLSESAFFYFHSNPKGLKHWVMFFTEQEYINLFQAVFYYKQYPEKLYDHQLSSEKLLSASKRLNSIYQLIEEFHQQFLILCTQHHLPSIKDYLFHGDDLPAGVTVQVGLQDRLCIQNLVKLHAVNYFIPLDTQNLYKKLYEVCRAYKYWFNPSRLVDAAMVLQQSLLNQGIDERFNEALFKEKMLNLYQHLNTTDCLDLYGYYSNKGTSYLLRILHAITQNHSLSCFGSLTEVEKKAVLRVYLALLNMMEALREELAQRNIKTDVYPYDLSKPVTEVGRRNIAAIKRVIAVYGQVSPIKHRTIEDLFDLFEE